MSMQSIKHDLLVPRKGLGMQSQQMFIQKKSTLCSSCGLRLRFSSYAKVWKPLVLKKCDTQTSVEECSHANSPHPHLTWVKGDIWCWSLTLNAGFKQERRGQDKQIISAIRLLRWAWMLWSTHLMVQMVSCELKYIPTASKAINNKSNVRFQPNLLVIF